MRNSISRRQAVNSIIGAISRNLERYLAHNWDIKPFNRNYYQPQPPLSCIIFNKLLDTNYGGVKKHITRANEIDNVIVSQAENYFRINWFIPDGTFFGIASRSDITVSDSSDLRNCERKLTSCLVIGYFSASIEERCPIKRPAISASRGLFCCDLNKKGIGLKWCSMTWSIEVKLPLWPQGPVFVTLRNGGVRKLNRSLAKPVAFALP